MLYYFKKDPSFHNYQTEIRKHSFMMLRAISIGLFFISIITLLLSINLPIFESSFLIYLVWFCLSSTMILLCYYNSHFAIQHSVKLLYFCLTIQMVTACISGTVYYQSHNSAVLIGLLAVVPFVLLDQVYRLYIFEFSSALLFCLLSFLFKDFSIALVDCMNSLGFALVACIVGTLTIEMKMNSFFTQAMVVHQRDTDPLTGISSRLAAEKLIHHWLEKGSGVAAFFILDVDFFKSINDTFGHLEGDHVLIETAEILQSCFSDLECIARLGGDEFMIFTTLHTEREQLQHLAEMLKEKLHRVIVKQNVSLTISSSIGITLCHPHQEFDEIYSRADKALYKVKSTGRNHYLIDTSCIAK